MKLEQQQQAENLYFQTDLNKTQIAETLGISRRTLHNWVRENNWEYLKRSGNAMPSLIAANCYQAMAQLSEHILSPERAGKPITREEVDSLYKLTLTINKLKARSILTESMETFTGFLESMRNKSPELADSIGPLISRYVSSGAAANIYQLKRDASRTAPASHEDNIREAQLDKEDLRAWAEETASANTTQNPGETPGQPAQAQNQNQIQKPPKFDLRKQLRGTATTGPGKVLQKQKQANAAA